MAEPRLRRRVRSVVRGVRRAAAGGHGRRRRAHAGPVPDAARVDGRHDRPRGHARRRRGVRDGPVRRSRRAARPRAARPHRGAVGRRRRVRPARGRHGPRNHAPGADRARPRALRRPGARRHPRRHAPLLRRLRPPALQAAGVAADAGRRRERRQRRGPTADRLGVLHRPAGPRRRRLLRAAARPPGRARRRSSTSRWSRTTPTIKRRARRPHRSPTSTTRWPARPAGSRPWGICTECGMGRVDAGDVPRLLDIHRQILAS